MHSQKEEFPEAVPPLPKANLTEEHTRQAYIEERIRLGLAEQTRVRAKWEEEDESQRQSWFRWKAGVWRVFKIVGVLAFAALCVLGWLLTLWQPPSVDVAINYASVLGAWFIGLHVLRSWIRIRPTRVWAKSLLWAGSLSLVMGGQMWFDHYEIQIPFENGSVVTARWGRFHPMWNHQRIVMPDSFSSLQSMQGPITRSGSRQGKWIFEYHTLPSKDKWYWQDEEVSETEWKQRDGAMKKFGVAGIFYDK